MLEYYKSDVKIIFDSHTSPDLLGNQKRHKRCCISELPNEPSKLARNESFVRKPTLQKSKPVNTLVESFFEG